MPMAPIEEEGIPTDGDSNEDASSSSGSDCKRAASTTAKSPHKPSGISPAKKTQKSEEEVDDEPLNATAIFASPINESTAANPAERIKSALKKIKLRKLNNGFTSYLIEQVSTLHWRLVFFLLHRPQLQRVYFIFCIRRQCPKLCCSHARTELSRQQTVPQRHCHCFKWSLHCHCEVDANAIQSERKSKQCSLHLVRP